MKTETQRQRIVKLLKQGWISPLKALKVTGSLKLATRVSELRQQGYIIADKWAPNRAYKMYFLLKSPGQ